MNSPAWEKAGKSRSWKIHQSSTPPDSSAEGATVRPSPWGKCHTPCFSPLLLLGLSQSRFPPVDSRRRRHTASRKKTQSKTIDQGEGVRRPELGRAGKRRRQQQQLQGQLWYFLHQPFLGPCAMTLNTCCRCHSRCSQSKLFWHKIGNNLPQIKLKINVLATKKTQLEQKKHKTISYNFLQFLKFI